MSQIIIYKNKSLRNMNFFYTCLPIYFLVCPFYKFYQFFFLPKFSHLTQMSGIFFFFFKKIKFRGKGYYMYRNRRNTIVFRFGKSHRTYRYGFYLFLKVLSKTSIFFASRSLLNLNFFLLSVFSVRPINLFTLRGIRFTRQIIYKKIGKISSYR